jgi:hypothetical protein
MGWAAVDLPTTYHGDLEPQRGSLGATDNNYVVEFGYKKLLAVFSRA